MHPLPVTTPCTVHRAPCHRAPCHRAPCTVYPTLPPAPHSVMSFSEGLPLKSRAQLLAAGIDLPLLVARVCEAWAQQTNPNPNLNPNPNPNPNPNQVHDYALLRLETAGCPRERVTLTPNPNP